MRNKYIGEFHAAPGPALAPAFARRSDLRPLADFGKSTAGPIKSGRSASDSDIRDIIRAAIRIQKGGGDLRPQMEAWRSYLKRFKNTAELVAEIDQTLPRPYALLIRQSGTVSVPLAHRGAALVLPLGGGGGGEKKKKKKFLIDNARSPASLVMLQQ